MGYGIPFSTNDCNEPYKKKQCSPGRLQDFVENKLLHKFELIILFTHRGITLPQTNSEFTPENGCLEYERFLLGQKACFQGQAVSFREGNHLEKKRPLLIRHHKKKKT